MRREFEVEIKNIGRKEELHEMEKKIGRLVMNWVRA